VSVHGIHVYATITTNEIHSKSNIHLPSNRSTRCLSTAYPSTSTTNTAATPIISSSSTNDYTDTDDNVEVLYDPGDIEDEVPFGLLQTPPDDVVPVQQQQLPSPTLVQVDDDDVHPRPIGNVRSTHVSFFVHEYPLLHLVMALADKGVKVFILFNYLDMPVSVLFPNRAAALLSTPNIKHKVDCCPNALPSTPQDLLPILQQPAATAVSKPPSSVGTGAPTVNAPALTSSSGSIN
jgi:hypothetical protein